MSKYFCGRVGLVTVANWQHLFSLSIHWLPVIVLLLATLRQSKKKKKSGNFCYQTGSKMFADIYCNFFKLTQNIGEHSCQVTKIPGSTVQT